MELCLLFLAEHHVRRPLRQHSRDFPHAPPRDWKRPRRNGQQDHGNSRAHHCHGCRFGAIQRCRLHCGWYVRRRFHRYSLLAVRDSRQDEHVKGSLKLRRVPSRPRSFPFRLFGSPFFWFHRARKPAGSFDNIEFTQTPCSTNSFCSIKPHIEMYHIPAHELALELVHPIWVCRIPHAYSDRWSQVTDLQPLVTRRKQKRLCSDTFWNAVAMGVP